MPVSSQVLKMFHNPVYIETGTFRCESLRAAIDADCFERFVTIELDDDLAQTALRCFRNDPRVTCMHGSSAARLAEALRMVGDDPATVYLDAHGLAGKTDGSPSPLIDELRTLAEFKRRDDTIIIDDAGVFGRAFRANVTEADVRRLLDAIRDDYLTMRIDNPHGAWGSLVACPPERIA